MGGTQTWPQPPPQAAQAGAGSLAARLASLADDIAAEGGMGALRAMGTTDPATPGGRLALRMLAAVAEHERAEASRVAGEALAAARGRGVSRKAGHPRALDDEAEAEVVRQWAVERVPVAEIARRARVSRGAIARILDRHGVRPRAEGGQ